MMNTTHIVILVSNHEASWYLLVLTMNDFELIRDKVEKGVKPQNFGEK